MNKSLVRFILMGVLISILAANCTGAATPAQDAANTSTAVPSIQFQPQTVNWMGHWLGEDKRELLVREVAGEFAFKNPGVTVNLRFPLEILGVRSQVETANLIVQMIQTDRYPWDIIWMDTTLYALVAERLHDPNWGSRYLVDFAQFPRFRETQKPFIIQDSNYRDQTGGILVGPYIEGYYYAIYFNQDVAQRIGLHIRTHGMTFDDLLGYVQQVAAYNQAHNTDIAAFYESSDWTTLEILFQQLVKSALGDFNAARQSRTSEKKQAALRRTLEAFEKLGSYKPLIKSYATNLWFETRDLILKDQALFYVNGTWMYSHWRSLDRERFNKMVPAELPVFQYTDFYVGGYIPVWAVFKQSPHRDLAVDLLLYWAQPDIAERWVTYTKNPTGIIGNLGSATLGSDPYSEFQETMTSRYGSRIDYTTNAGYLLGAENGLLQPLLNELLIKLLTQQITANDAYESLLTAMKPSDQPAKPNENFFGG